MIVIDATDLIAGRLASNVAKLAMQGETIRIINSEKALISGDPNKVIKDWVDKIHRGHTFKGPYQPRRADMILKRIIRGMIPYRKELGVKAFKRIKTYLGSPKEFESVKPERLKSACFEGSKIIKFITIGDLSKRLGGKL